jgi:prepilin-type N-terminal cleavage/methylation domain-containing protein
MKSKQSGFTLVEIAIVLVIVGLLLGGVLKGQELITSSKAKALFADRAAVQTAYNAYNDRFRAIPGDDSAAAARFTGLACGVAGAGASAVNSGAGQSCMNGDGNGLITNVAQGTRLTAAQGAALLLSTQSAAQATANEAYKFWQHLRAAQLIKTDGSGTGEIFMQPLNGALGWTAVNSGGVYVGQQPSSLYLTQFLTPGNVAQAIDGANDDGFTNLGGIRSASNGGGTNPNSQPGAAYIPGTNYNVSMNLL